MISRRANGITRTSNVLDRIAARQFRTVDGLDVSADELKIPSNLIEILAPAIVLRFDAQGIPDDVLVMRSNVLALPSASRGMTLDILIRSATALSCAADGMNRSPDLHEGSFDVQWLPAYVMKMRSHLAEMPADSLMD